MKSITEIKPECIVKLTTVGTSKGFALPVWFTEQWDLQKGKRYKIEVIEEALSHYLSLAKQWSKVSNIFRRKVFYLSLDEFRNPAGLDFRFEKPVGCKVY